MRVSKLALLVLFLVGGLALGVFTPGPALALSRHALPTIYSPTPNAVLKTPPTKVVIRFSEHLNADISKIVVVDPSNKEVDDRDSAISSDDYAITVTLPVLPAGTYVVAWRSHSADDGHVVGGSYIFHIARADGTVPALTGALPSGNIVGGAGMATSALDLPTLIEAVARWMSVMALTVLLGMLFWWRFVLPRQPAVADDVRTDLVKRWRQGAELAFEALIGATVVEVLAQGIVVDGTIRGATSPSLLGSILFQSRFGWFLVARIVLSGIGIVCLNVPALRTSLRPRNLAWVLPFFGLLLALVFEYSGHGGAATVWWGPIIDYFHLLAMGIWLGGIFTLALFLLPALSQRPATERMAYLSASLPAFSVPALVAATLLATTGSLNADTRMTGLAQLWTTGYGIVLLIKIGLFLVMVGISYYHAFRLRPQLALQLGAAGQSAAPAPLWARVPVVRWVEQRMALFEQWQAPRLQPTLAVSGTKTAVGAHQQSGGAQLAQSIQRWLRVEAGIGMAVLLCAMLLGPLAGTLAPKIVTTNSFGASGGSQQYTQTVEQLKVTLAVTPGKFGTNTMTVAVTNPDGSAASGGSVELLTEMVEMDMGENSFQLTATSLSGTYAGPVELPMAGHWKVTAIIRTQQDPQHLHRTTFTVSASY